MKAPKPPKTPPAYPPSNRHATATQLRAAVTQPPCRRHAVAMQKRSGNHAELARNRAATAQQSTQKPPPTRPQPPPRPPPTACQSTTYRPAPPAYAMGVRWRAWYTRWRGMVNRSHPLVARSRPNGIRWAASAPEFYEWNQFFQFYQPARPNFPPQFQSSIFSLSPPPAAGLSFDHN